MDLNHGTEDGRPYPYTKPPASNRDFALVFETLLREVWTGYVNRQNQGTANPTDDNAILELVRRLREMLNARRINANLAREEFDAVATLSWFFLTVAYNTAVIQNLNAAADGVADRLRMIGERVGLMPHARADSYFQLAAPMSVVLRAIELDAVGGAGNLYVQGGFFTALMLQIITHWSIATGRDLKALPAWSGASGGVLQATAPGAYMPQPVSVMSGNGSGANRLAGVMG
jgi:hypothetical protein